MGGGIFIGNSGFLIFESTMFANQFRTRFGLPTKNHGFITLRGLSYFYGSVCIICSILIFFFKRENRKNNENQNSKLSIVNAYKRIWKIFKLKPMHKLILLILTMRVIFIFIYYLFKTVFYK
jgi:hypothetical protein